MNVKIIRKLSKMVKIYHYNYKHYIKNYLCIIPKELLVFIYNFLFDKIILTAEMRLTLATNCQYGWLIDQRRPSM